MQAELRVIGGKQQGKIIPLTMKKFLIGREKDCHLRPNNDLISRHHCVLTIDEFTVRIRDLGSTNGTYVNSERIQGQVILKHGDQLAIGKLLFEIAVQEVEAAPDSEQPVEEAALLETDAFTSRPTPQPQTVGSEEDTTLNIAAASETITLPVQAVDSEEPPSGVYGGDTVSIPSPTPVEGALQQQPAAPIPQAPMQQIPGMPQGQYVQQPMPQQFPQQMPMMPQQFPQQMPMMPQQFPQQMPMMPQQFPHPIPMMPQPVQMAPQAFPTEMTGMMPPVPQDPAAQAALPQQPTEEAGDLDVKLPRPEETGATEAGDNMEPTGNAQQGTENSGPEVVDPRVAAADIIRQYTHRPIGQ